MIRVWRGRTGDACRIVEAHAAAGIDRKLQIERETDPDIDCAGLGTAQGAMGFPPVTKTGDLMPTFAKAIAAVEAGQVAVVDVRVEPGYSAVATAAMLRGTEKA